MISARSGTSSAGTLSHVIEDMPLVPHGEPSSRLITPANT